jgi:hypothetical protein
MPCQHSGKYNCPWRRAAALLSTTTREKEEEYDITAYYWGHCIERYMRAHYNHGIAVPV